MRGTSQGYIGKRPGSEEREIIKGWSEQEKFHWRGGSC